MSEKLQLKKRIASLRKSRKVPQDTSKGPFGVIDFNDFSSEGSELYNVESSDLQAMLDKSVLKPVAKVEPPVVEYRVETKLHHSKKTLLKKQTAREKKKARELGLLNLMSVPAKVEAEFKKNSKAQHQNLYELLMTVIVPLELAVDPSIADTIESLKLITGLQEVTLNLTRAKSILNDIVDLKLANYFANVVSLDAKSRELLLAKHFSGISTQTKPKDPMKQIIEALSRSQTSSANAKKKVENGPRDMVTKQKN